MKHKLKKWHIALMSFLTLFIAVFASLFSLQADTVDDETGEILTDDWNFDIVFYDSSIDNGKTPLTEINWNASTGGYDAGDPRVIKVQINYKNNSTVTSYDIGELEILIPNLIAEITDETQISYTVTLGANDATHTGYDFDVVDDGKILRFANAIPIEPNSNFEGAIQIAYSITPLAEVTTQSSKNTIEQYLDSCIHKYTKKLQAALGSAGQTMTVEETLMNIETTITSPNWPNKYDNNLSSNTTYWEYESTTSDTLILEFDKTSYTQSNKDYIYIYNKNGVKLYSLSGSSMAGKKIRLDSNYVKIAMSSNDSTTYKGFSVAIGSDTETTITIPDKMLKSNVLNFNYKKTYIHPWTKVQYELTKVATKITSLDLLPNASNYIWVTYQFSAYSPNHNRENPYPYISVKTAYIEDIFPEECIVLDSSMVELTPDKDNMYQINIAPNNWGKTTYTNIYVGYPTSTYNETNQNLNITNIGYLYGDYKNNIENFEFLDDSSVSLNLADFGFTYPSKLYSIGKYYYHSKQYWETFNGTNPEAGTGLTTACIRPYAIYTGKPMTLKFGDDLLYISGNDGNYRRLQEDEYYFSKVSYNGGDSYNGQGIKIKTDTYDMELWIKYKDSSDYVLYSSFKNPSGTKSFTFTESQHVIAYYFVIKDLNESFRLRPNASNASTYANLTKAEIIINKAKNIASTGKIYNFAFMETIIDGVTVNTPTLDSYATITTKEEIAQYDLNTYGKYMQRDEGNLSYSPFSPSIKTTFSISSQTKLSDIIQDDKNEIFTGTNNLSFYVSGYIECSAGSSIEKHASVVGLTSKVQGIEAYALLPEGMTLNNSEQELINRLKIGLPEKMYSGTGTELSSENVSKLINDNLKLEVIHNYNNTNRTKIAITSLFLDTPIILKGKISLDLTYDFYITYDDYLDYGQVWKTTFYAAPYNRDIRDYRAGALSQWMVYSPSTTISDNGTKDIQASDINQNGNIAEKFAYSESAKTVVSVISTYQDLTTFVKTDYSNYSTGIVDASCSSEYTYKLRVRTGAADVTNLTIYCNLEEAQPQKTRWKGELLNIDTSRAVEMGYNIKIWYSESITAGKLKEDNSWKEYSNTIDKTKIKSLAFEYLDTNGNSAVIPSNSITYVLINMKAPSNEGLTTLARNNCWTEWNALDDYGQPVDFITGINSNVVKVALPNSVKTDDMPSISLRFAKEITGTEEAFKNMNLNKTNNQVFKIRLTSLTANDDGSYNQITALLNSNQELVITQIPVGTYLLEELGDNYFDFVDFTDNNDPEIIIEGVTFERTDQGYIITVSENLAETVEFNIKVTNEIEDERFYEDKDNKENLFLKNKIEKDSV